MSRVRALAGRSNMLANRLSDRLRAELLPCASQAESAGTYCDVCGGPHVQNHTLGRLRWAARTAWHADPLTLMARFRLLWHDFVIHGLLNKGGERCQDCGRDTGWFQVDDDEWIAVMGYPSGLLCRPCFTVRGDERAVTEIVDRQPERDAS